MSGAVSGGYLPVYPHHGELPDPEVRTFITNFYRASDKQEANELWVSCFTEDAQVTIGSDSGRGEQAIRELRGRMWTKVQERQHRVFKVFPGLFQDREAAAEGAVECELMLFGDVRLRARDGDASEALVPWAAHAVLRKPRDGAQREEWKIAHYQVWLQK